MYIIIYLGIHMGLTAIYQTTRCDVLNNGTVIPDKKCTNLLSSFVKGFNTEKVKADFNNLPTMIAFLMGFYVNMVVVRWWE